MRRLLLLMLLSLLLAGCGVGNQPAGTKVDQADATTPAAATSTPIPGLETLQPRAGAILDISDPAAPELIEPQGEAFRLQPGWEVASISSLYRWSGSFADSPIDYQQVERDGAGYRRSDSSPVDQQAVQNLLAGLARLYPSPGLWPSYRDGSPRWSVEILGTDGHRVYISSSNIGNPGHAPWTIVYNGDSYVQYDGSLAAPLAALFPGDWSPTAS